MRMTGFPRTVAVRDGSRVEAERVPPPMDGRGRVGSGARRDAHGRANRTRYRCTRNASKGPRTPHG